MVWKIVNYSRAQREFQMKRGKGGKNPICLII